jgi:hypothetical protein
LMCVVQVDGGHMRRGKAVHHLHRLCLNLQAFLIVATTR